MKKSIKMRLRPLIFSLILTLFAISLFGSFALAASSIDKGKVKEFRKIAESVPENAALTILIGDIRRTLNVIDKVMKKYQTADPTFRYDQMIFSLKGGLGYNPLSPSEVDATGIDIDQGIAVFNIDQTKPPMFVFQAKDVEKAKKALDYIAVSMVGVKPIDGLKKHNGHEIKYFSKTGQMDKTLELGYTTQGKTMYLVGNVGSHDYFVSLLEKTTSLKKGKSLTKNRHFNKLLKRLEQNPSVVVYSNYEKYLSELKKQAQGAKEGLKEGFEGKKAIEDDKKIDAEKIAGVFDEALKLAEGFDAQIFALSVDEHKFGFMHHTIGKPAEVKKLEKFFKLKGASKLVEEKIFNPPIARIYGKLNFSQVVDHFFKSDEKDKTSWKQWREKAKKETGIDFDTEIIANVTGEIAAGFYGMKPLPTTMTKAKSVSEEELTGLAKLVIIAPVENQKTARKVLEKSKKQAKEGKANIKKVSPIKGGDFYEVTTDGLSMQYGIYKGFFLFGFGKDSIKAAIASSGGNSFTPNGNFIGYLDADFTRFAKTMENLKPPVDSPNTQLHQQYRAWRMVAEPKFKFLKGLKIEAFINPDGFSTVGELTY